MKKKLIEKAPMKLPHLCYLLIWKIFVIKNEMSSRERRFIFIFSGAFSSKTILVAVSSNAGRKADGNR